MSSATPQTRLGFISLKGCRPSKLANEDRISCIDYSLRDQNEDSLLTAYVSVIDGHGGNDCAEYVNESLANRVSRSFKSEEEWVRGEDVLKDLFHELDQEYCGLAEEKEETSGACATVVAIRGDEALVANIGDCRAVHVNSKGKVLKAINDHRAGDEKEKKRISRAGGRVNHGRVLNLEPSRTFGDIDVKSIVGDKVVIATPEVERFKFKRAKGDFLIVASDGLWDKVPNHVAAKVCQKILSSRSENSPSVAAHALAKLAVDNNSSDDITIAVVAF